MTGAEVVDDVVGEISTCECVDEEAVRAEG